MDMGNGRAGPGRVGLGWPALGGVCLLVFGLAVWLHGSPSARARGSEKRGAPPAQGLDEEYVRQLEQELDGILATQQTILDRFDDILQELDIVKVRAMRRRAP